jgi:hypothetical protein
MICLVFVEIILLYVLKYLKVFKRGHRSVFSPMFHLFILFVTLRFPNLYAFHHVFGIVGKPSMSRGVPSKWFCNV